MMMNAFVPANEGQYQFVQLLKGNKVSDHPVKQHASVLAYLRVVENIEL